MTKAVAAMCGRGGWLMVQACTREQQARLTAAGVLPDLRALECPCRGRRDRRCTRAARQTAPLGAACLDPGPAPAAHSPLCSLQPLARTNLARASPYEQERAAKLADPARLRRGGAPGRLVCQPRRVLRTAFRRCTAPLTKRPTQAHPLRELRRSRASAGHPPARPGPDGRTLGRRRGFTCALR